MKSPGLEPAVPRLRWLAASGSAKASAAAFAAFMNFPDLNGEYVYGFFPLVSLFYFLKVDDIIWDDCTTYFLTGDFEPDKKLL